MSDEKTRAVQAVGIVNAIVDCNHNGVTSDIRDGVKWCRNCGALGLQSGGGDTFWSTSVCIASLRAVMQKD